MKLKSSEMRLESNPQYIHRLGKSEPVRHIDNPTVRIEMEFTDEPEDQYRLRVRPADLVAAFRRRAGLESGFGELRAIWMTGGDDGGMVELVFAGEGFGQKNARGMFFDSITGEGLSPPPFNVVPLNDPTKDEREPFIFPPVNEHPPLPILPAGLVRICGVDTLHGVWAPAWKRDHDGSWLALDRMVGNSKEAKILGVFIGEAVVSYIATAAPPEWTRQSSDWDVIGEDPKQPAGGSDGKKGGDACS